VDDAGIVFVEPVSKLGVGYENPDRVARLEKQSGWPKPGIEAMPVDLGFDPLEDFFPEIHVLYS